MSRDRGIRLQNALARYLAEWWPSAESAGAGRQGSDILGTPGIVWENKTAREFRPASWIKQARAHGAAGQGLPVVAYWPDGVGEGTPQAVMAIVPLPELVGLLIEAGYNADRPAMIEAIKGGVR